jgi:hypothetical protein
MDRIREQLKNPLAMAVAGLVIGLIIGLPILGWWIWPVQWYDAAPVHLSQSYQQDFLCMTIDSYAQNNDMALALRRYQALGDKGMDVLSGLNASTCSSKNETALQAFRILVGQSASSVSSTAIVNKTPVQPTIANSSTTAGATSIAPIVTPVPTSESSGSPLIIILIIMLALTVAVGIAAYYLFVVRNRQGVGRMVSSSKRTEEMPEMDEEEQQQPDYTSQDQEAPIAQFMTTYMLGDDLYDDSFSIDAPSGEFLGECGVGITETVGVGDPKKVTAFEVWLFDKNDIQTVTKMLMSDHAFNDPNIRQKLMAKGELVRIEPGQRVLMETATLQLEARVVDVNYGQGPLPPNSFFDRMTLELAIWSKV